MRKGLTVQAVCEFWRCVCGGTQLRWREAEELVNKMEGSAGVEGDVYSYSHLINAYVRSGRPLQAREALGRMLSRGVVPNVQVRQIICLDHTLFLVPTRTTTHTPWCQHAPPHTLPRVTTHHHTLSLVLASNITHTHSS